MSQQIVKAESIEDVERECVDSDRASGRLGKETSMSFDFCQGLGFLLRTVVAWTCPLRYAGAD